MKSLEITSLPLDVQDAIQALVLGNEKIEQARKMIAVAEQAKKIIKDFMGDDGESYQFVDRGYAVMSATSQISGQASWDLNHKLLYALLCNPEAKDQVQTHFDLKFESRQGSSKPVRDTLEAIMSALQASGFAGKDRIEAPETTFLLQDDNKKFAKRIKVL